MNTKVYMEFIKQVMQPSKLSDGLCDNKLKVMQPAEYFKSVRKSMDRKKNKIRLKKLQLVKRVDLDDLDDYYGADEVIEVLIEKHKQHIQKLKSDSTRLADYADLKKLEKIADAMQKNAHYSEYKKEESLGVWKVLQIEKLQRAMKKAEEARDGDTSEEDELVTTFRAQLRGVERALAKCKAKKTCSQEKDIKVEKELGLVDTKKEISKNREMIKKQFDLTRLEDMEDVDPALMDQLKHVRKENPYSKAVFVETNPNTLEHEIIIES